MLGDYSLLRKMGHGRAHAFKKSSEHFLTEFVCSFLNLDYDELLEVSLEEDLSNLEKMLDPNYKSGTRKPISSIKFERCPRTVLEMNLAILHPIYLNERGLLSDEQIRRYEASLKKLPQQYGGYLESIEKGDLEGYWQRKDEEWLAEQNK